MEHDFVDKLATIHNSRKRGFALILAPRIERLPLPIQTYDDPFLPFGKAIINATRDLVSAYLFDLAAYLALGAAGAIALERTINYAGGDSITVLHGAFATPAYARINDEGAFNADAVTVIDNHHLEAFTSRPKRGVFIIRSGEAKMMDPPGKVGIYWQEIGLLTISNKVGEAINLRVLGDSVIYASLADDFAEQARAALEKITDE
ncbi:MAG: hypothetical protein H7Y09_08855 [Chitinophagaceae bacterium]|nr:hypothetical protein [Anaerolineae bacterium]